MHKFIIIINDIITSENMFNIFIKFGTKFQFVIAIHNIDIISENNSKIIINIPIMVNDIEFNF